MRTKDLKPGYYMYGNKGAMWTNKAHIAKAGSSLTICGSYMLARNHCKMNEIKEIGCPVCLEKYDEDVKR